MMSLRTTSLLLATLLLAACGGSPVDGPGGGAGGEDAGLPSPAGASGSVTGMPDRPGPGQIGAPTAAVPVPEAVALDADGNPILPEDAPITETPDTVDAVAEASAIAAVDEPGVDAAVEVVREYFNAINHGDFAHAYALWSDGGRASGQSPQQFAAGFNDTSGISVQIGTPGTVEGAAGSRYVPVPVTLVARQRDGSERRMAGTLTLRRTVVDGAGDEQRTWRIQRAQLGEAAP